MTASSRRPPLRLVHPPPPDAAGPDPDPVGPVDTAATGHGIEASPEVVRAVGAATVMRLRADGGMRQEYRCPFCDRPARGTASLIVFRYGNDLSVVRLAHATCSPSAVLRILSTPTSWTHRVRATCWLRRTGPGSTCAVLLVDTQVRAWPRHHARQATDGYTRALEAAGFTPVVDRDDERPAPPALAATLVVTADGVARIRVTHPSGVVFDGTVSVPDPWLRQARHDRAVTVLTGTGIPAATSTRRGTSEDGRRLLDGVTAALAAGRIWTAEAALVIRDRTQETPEEHRQLG